MARKITMGADWNAMHPWLDGPLQLWSRYPCEVAPDLIVVPLLFLTLREPRGGEHEHACTLEPHGLVVLHARGKDHLAMLLDEVAPRLAHLPFAFVLDADLGILHPASRPGLAREVELLPALLVHAIRQYAPEQLSPTFEPFWSYQREAVSKLPRLSRESEFRALPAIREQVADAAKRAEATPLRLWEAMLLRGENYRWELINGEVPLVGELWSPLAANRTLMQCCADAERAFETSATEAEGWIRCGPMRMRQRGSRVELRYRPSPADRRAAFLPRARLAGDDELPTLWGALLAGGGKGKTEMMASYTDSIIEVHPQHSPEHVANELAAKIRRVTAAEVHVAGESAAGEPPGWPSEPGDAWHVHHWGRWVAVLMPMGRAEHLPWEAQAGFHLSDRFMFWWWAQQRDSEVVE